ncbi:maleylpyruvate isomerase family mycothiol-dependent enzyme [Hoyosella altamirensis]|uniref:Uncharacterized protein (TIGR03083 family) n=1 Tax=Hoyosella altamirensis TaxID=616997 RepID=A0A839RIW0_9ACTN|nr:maleylpyruvate isomerase family mycothiol-dependent enzyme [Hoyosella altamirensis]MBB3036605.1 uncharacterized protein (TIGR03083 family) [Hoyosella altamirensis]
MTMSATPVTVSTIASISHSEAHDLAREAYERFAAVLRQVQPDQWSNQTDCAAWTVRDLAGHLAGAMQSAASARQMIREQWEVKRRAKTFGGDEVDHMTAIQVERTAHLSTAELVSLCTELAPKAARGRSRIPAAARRFARFPVIMGDQIDETWSLGYLVDVILTRDTWLHRIDLCRAIGVNPVLDAEHDGRIISDIVAEWARRHGKPFYLTLTGPAGGVYENPGADAEKITIDAVEYCRILSGRTSGEGLLGAAVPF